MADRTTHSHDTSTPAMSDETVPSEEFVLVPREPTEAMLDAYWHQAGESREMRSRVHTRAQIYWSAMIEAAPTPSASHLAKEGGEAGAVEPIEKHRIANRLCGMFDMSMSSADDFNRLTPAGFRLLRQAHDALIAPDEAVAAPAPNSSPAAKGGDAEALRERIARALNSVLGSEEDEHPRYHPAQKSWEEPSEVWWTQWLEAADAVVAALATPSPQPADAVREDGRAKAKAKQALYSLRFTGQPMSSMFNAEELGLIVDTVRAALASDPAPAGEAVEPVSEAGDGEEALKALLAAIHLGHAACDGDESSSDLSAFREAYGAHNAIEQLLVSLRSTLEAERARADAAEQRAADALARAEKAEAEKKGAEDWQPIETAPRDGTPFLGWDGYSMWPCAKVEDGPVTAIGQRVIGIMCGSDVRLWRPLPAPPRDLSQGGQHG